MLFDRLMSFAKKTPMYKFAMARQHIVLKSPTLSHIYFKIIKKYMITMGFRTIPCYTNNMSPEQSLNEIQKFCDTSKREKILFAGHICYSNRIPYIAEMAKKLPEYQFIVFVENGASNYNRIQTFKYEGFTNQEDKNWMKFFISPGILTKDKYPCYESKKITKEMRDIINSKSYLMDAEAVFKKRHYDMGSGYPAFFAYSSYVYINSLLDIMNPAAIVLWNMFHPLHHIFDEVCKERGIKTIYFEFGTLPGTYAFEKYGQMGESYPAKYCEDFKNLEINNDDLENAKKVSKYLYESGLYRTSGTYRNISAITKKMKPARPTIFFAGQNDYESGLFPYSEHTKKCHSPIFKSSDEAAEFLSNVAEKNNWNFIYKKHPLVTAYELPKKTQKNVISGEGIGINDLIDLSDVTITILSQTGYVSTIRKKPTIMLGYTQLKNKGCTYEAFTKEDIEPTILKALVNGFTANQEEAFEKHVAQVVKYYVYDDLTKKPLTYGKSIDDSAMFLKKELLNENERGDQPVQ